LSKRIYRLLGLSGYARLDYRLTERRRLYLLEANPTCLAPENAPALGLASPFALEHLRSFQPHKAGVSKIEGYGETGHALRCEELFRQPHMRKGDKVASGELAVQARDTACQQRVVEPQWQVA
jgi:hypothetical protein